MAVALLCSNYHQPFQQPTNLVDRVKQATYITISFYIKFSLPTHNKQLRHLYSATHLVLHSHPSNPSLKQIDNLGSRTKQTCKHVIILKHGSYNICNKKVRIVLVIIILIVTTFLNISPSISPLLPSQMPLQSNHQ